MNSRARNGESSANSGENFTFHGHTLWEMWRYNRFEIPLTTGQRTLNPDRASLGTCVGWGTRRAVLMQTRPRGMREKAAPADADGPPEIPPRRLAPNEATRRQAVPLQRPTGWAVRATWDVLCQAVTSDTTGVWPLNLP